MIARLLAWLADPFGSDAAAFRLEALAAQERARRRRRAEEIRASLARLDNGHARERWRITASLCGIDIDE